MCIGLTYHGKAADIWALGCTLYCMVLGCYPFKGETLQSTYEKVLYDLFSSTVGPLAWLGYCFHIQAEHNFVILMSKQHNAMWQCYMVPCGALMDKLAFGPSGLPLQKEVFMEILHQIRHYVTAVSSCCKPNDSCFLLAVELMMRTY